MNRRFLDKYPLLFSATKTKSLRRKKSSSAKRTSKSFVVEIFYFRAWCYINLQLKTVGTVSADIAVIVNLGGTK